VSAVTIELVIPPESQALIKKYEGAPEEAPRAIARGMTRALEQVRKRLVTTRLFGQGPFPPEEHRLGQRTGQLAASVRVEPAVVTGNEVVGGIGSPVIYAKVHEFGVVITPKKAKFLVFNIGEKKVFAKKVVIPERAPFRTGVAENLDYIAEEIGAEIKASLQ